MHYDITYEIIKSDTEQYKSHVGTKWVLGVARYGERLYELRNGKLHYVHFDNAHLLIKVIDPIRKFKYSGFTFQLVVTKRRHF